MKEGLRQSMAWLHSWTGLLVGWVLYFVFVTGTFGYVNSEINRWMRPELPLAGDLLPAAEMLPAAEKWLRHEAGDAKSWFIFLPGRRGDTQLEAGWSAWPEGEERYGAFTRSAIDPRTGLGMKDAVRETEGGDGLYAMHYQLHYMSYDWAIRIVGICAMFMLVAILSGIITHKKIFKDFFTFRPAKGQRSWLDAHNLLSVTALPFHLMITWSGLVFFLFTYMPTPIDLLYPEGPARDRFYERVYGPEEGGATAKHGTLQAMAPLEPMLAQAERLWGKGSVSRIIIEHPLRSDAQVRIFAHNRTQLSRLGPILHFDGATGARLPGKGDQEVPSAAFSFALLAAHEGHFAGPILRVLYVVAGLAGAAMIATGLLLWSAKRKAKHAKAGTLPAGVALVDILNVGTIIGLPIGIAAYFWANRLLPAGWEGRGAWEMHLLFAAWAGTFLYAIWRPAAKVWIELCGVAAAAFGLLPLLNVLATQRHLGVTIPRGDWTLAALDLGALALAALFLRMRRTLIAKRDAAPAPRRRNAPAQEAAIA